MAEISKFMGRTILFTVVALVLLVLSFDQPWYESEYDLEQTFSSGYALPVHRSAKIYDNRYAQVDGTEYLYAYEEGVWSATNDLHSLFSWV